MNDCVEAGKLAVACVRGVSKCCYHVALQPVLIEAKVGEAGAIAGELATNLEILSRWSRRLWDLAESDIGRQFDAAAIELPRDEQFVPSAFSKAAWMARDFFLPVNLAIAKAADLVAESHYPESELLERLRDCVTNAPSVAEAFVIELDRCFRETEIQVDDAEVVAARIREEMAVLRGASFPQEPEAVALKTQKNLDGPTIKNLLVHVIGYSEHGKSYGLPPNKHPGLAHVWRPMRYTLLKRKFGGESDKETLENWLDYLEYERGFKRADVLERRLDDWQALLEVPPPQEPEQDKNTRPSRWPDDGPKAIERAFVWAGKRYEDIPPNAMRFLGILFEAEQQGRSVTKEEVEKKLDLHLGSESLFSRLFGANRGGKKAIHPVRELVTGRGDYRLIDRNHG